LILARNLLAGLTVAALLSNSEGTIVFLNDAAGDLLGRPFEELGHLTAAQWEHEFGTSDSSDGSGAEVGHLVASAARSGTPARQLLCLRTPNGQPIHAEASAVPLNTVDGFRGAVILISATHASED
jgi:PAS domain-containing protein